MFSLSSWISFLLIVLNCWAWADTEDISIEQPSRSVIATIGGSAILECRTKTNLPAGSVKWYKGKGPNRELIFSDTGSYSRVQKVRNTNRILDIRIINITSQDEGVYYCIKCIKNSNKEFGSESGTHLIVGSPAPQAPDLSLPPGILPPATTQSAKGEYQSSSGSLIAITATSVSLILILIVLCCYFKRQKGSSPCLSRLKASKKNQSKREPTRNDEIVYADLQHMGKNPQSMSPMEGKSLHSEYATIQVR